MQTIRGEHTAGPPNGKRETFSPSERTRKNVEMVLREIPQIFSASRQRRAAPRSRNGNEWDTGMEFFPRPDLAL